jgi:hypothetical protein
VRGVVGGPLAFTCDACRASCPTTFFKLGSWLCEVCRWPVQRRLKFHRSRARKLVRDHEREHLLHIGRPRV